MSRINQHAALYQHNCDLRAQSPTHLSIHAEAVKKRAYFPSNNLLPQSLIDFSRTASSSYASAHDGLDLAINIKEEQEAQVHYPIEPIPVGDGLSASRSIQPTVNFPSSSPVDYLQPCAPQCGMPAHPPGVAPAIQPRNNPSINVDDSHSSTCMLPAAAGGSNNVRIARTGVAYEGVAYSSPLEASGYRKRRSAFAFCSPNSQALQEEHYATACSRPEPQVSTDPPYKQFQTYGRAAVEVDHPPLGHRHFHGSDDYSNFRIASVGNRWPIPCFSSDFMKEEFKICHYYQLSILLDTPFWYGHLPNVSFQFIVTEVLTDPVMKDYALDQQCDALFQGWKDSPMYQEFGPLVFRKPIKNGEREEMKLNEAKRFVKFCLVNHCCAFASKEFDYDNNSGSQPDPSPPVVMAIHAGARHAVASKESDATTTPLERVQIPGVLGCDQEKKSAAAPDKEIDDVENVDSLQFCDSLLDTSHWNQNAELMSPDDVFQANSVDSNY